MSNELLERFPSLAVTAMDDGHSPLTKYASLGHKGEVLEMLSKITPESSQLIDSEQWNLINICAHQD
jgi:hypothetical protein